MAESIIAPPRTVRTNCDCGRDHKTIIMEMAKTVGDCWEWQGQLNKDGYGMLSHIKAWLAHRLSYVAFRGPIPDGLVIDHLCENRRCVNPDHLEAVTDRVNILRSSTGLAAINRRKTHCKNGHLLAGDNLRTNRAGRVCKICANEAQRQSRPLPLGDHRHGTISGYNNYKCRCADCTKAWAEHHRRYMQRRRQQRNQNIRDLYREGVGIDQIVVDMKLTERIVRGALRNSPEVDRG